MRSFGVDSYTSRSISSVCLRVVVEAGFEGFFGARCCGISIDALLSGPEVSHGLGLWPEGIRQRRYRDLYKSVQGRFALARRDGEKYRHMKEGDRAITI